MSFEERFQRYMALIWAVTRRGTARRPREYYMRLTSRLHERAVRELMRLT